MNRFLFIIALGDLLQTVANMVKAEENQKFWQDTENPGDLVGWGFPKNQMC